MRNWALWSDSQHGEAPDVRVIWDKRPVARRDHLCTICGDIIPAGARYSSNGIIVDGVFEASKTHLYGEMYPSGCPKLGKRDAAQLAAEFPPEFGYPMERTSR